MTQDTARDPMCGHRLARRLMRMVAVLHERGFESLYLHCGMNGSGSCWRYSIGAMADGGWPRRWRDPLQVVNSMDGSDASDQIAWAELDDSPEVLADKFMMIYPEIVAAARVPNAAYVAWYRHMLAVSEPFGLLVFYFDYKTDPRPEFWGDTHPGLFVDLPAGKVRDPWE